ncbi:TadE/TadG family type IV pilus assembly protein [Methylobacterium soli]|nr:TadE/TadG family type IV pilus assembly protein [Methylobacterium soli]GJE41390.1 hypothetical protein AEGHOMDF_0556 [Methylobacterium soli]
MKRIATEPMSSLPKIPAAPPGCRPPRPLLRARRFLRAERGSAAVEFSLVVIPFLSLLCATLEVAVGGWAEDMLQQAVAEAGRQIYTGRFQANTATTSGAANLLTAFRTELCKENGQTRRTLFTCANVRLNITQVDEFDKVALVSPTVTSRTGVNNWNPSFGGSYACGKNGGIVIIQAAVDFPVFFSQWSPGFVTLAGAKRVLQAATVFRVEPYDSTKVCTS